MNSAFSPDDRLLATASMDGAVRIWDVESASLFAIIRGHGGLVEHVEFSPAGNSLLTASHDGTARLWDIDGVLTTTLRHQHPPTFAVFSPDSKRIVTGGGDSVAHVWDVASGSEIAKLERTMARSRMRRSALMAVTSRPHLVTGILIWDVKSGRQIVRLEGHDFSCRPDSVQPEGRPLAIRISRWNGAAMECIDRSSDRRSESQRNICGKLCSAPMDNSC